MKILFIYSGAESLGIQCLSSFLKSKGHQTFLLYDPAAFSGHVFAEINSLSRLLSVDHKIIKKVGQIKPDLIGFSSYTGNYRWCLKIAKAIKKISNIPIVFGGIHPTAVPSRVLANDCIDYVIVGEGEYAMLDLIEHLERNEPKEILANTPNICFRQNGHTHINEPRPYIKDLDSLPFPDKKLFFEKEPLLKQNPYLIATSRGCYFNCNFCSENLQKKLYCHEKNHMRFRSPANVIQELFHAKRFEKIKHVIFLDATFAFKKSWIKKFLDDYQNKINLPFVCETHPLTSDRETVSMLQKAGCECVFMGVQSGSEKIRKKIYNRKESNDQIASAVSRYKKAGIKINVYHILGAPTETENDLKNSLNFYRKIKPDGIWVSWLTYYPGTHIINIAKEKGYLTQKDIDNISKGYSGYMYQYGSATKLNIPLCIKYEFLMRCSVFYKNFEKLDAFLESIATYIPFKKMINNILHLLTYLLRSGKVYRKYVKNKFRYALSRHSNAP